MAEDRAPVEEPTRDSGPTEPRSDIDPSVNFKLERYKFILQQLHALNENVYKYLTLFQTLATAIMGAGVGLFLSWRSLKITPDMAQTGLRGLLWLLTILAVFVVSSIVAGVLNWIDYRHEEVDLLDKEVSPEYRKRPNIWNFWRWYETFIVLFIIIMVIFIHMFVKYQLLPLIQLKP